MSFQRLAPSRRSHSPDRPFLNPRASAFPFPRLSVFDTPCVDETAAIDRAFPIPRPGPFPFPRVGPFALPQVADCCRASPDTVIH